MIVVNADDFGRSQPETDSILSCYREGRITSTSAMVFMEDSARAADRARECGIDVGLHLNLSQRYSSPAVPRLLDETQAQIVRFMKSSKYAVLLYHPGLRKNFRDVFNAQMDEFVALFGRPPSHIDGHQHRHLCANMLMEQIIPSGQKVRRNFSFFPGEKGWINRSYRRLIDGWLARRYRLTDYFFSLPQCLARDRLSRVAQLAQVSKVELMTHPAKADEYEFLLSDGCLNFFKSLETVSYATV